MWLLRDESPAKRSSRRSGTIKLAGSNRAAQAAASNHDSSSVAAGDAGPANDADDALGVEELVTHHSSQHLADGPGFGSEPVVHGSDATKVAGRLQPLQEWATASARLAGRKLRQSPAGSAGGRIGAWPMLLV